MVEKENEKLKQAVHKVKKELESKKEVKKVDTIETGVLPYYHPSQNNARFVYLPHLIRTED